MPGFVGIRIQVAAVILLFLCSLATVIASALQTIYLPHAEEQVQNRLREASRRLAETADSEIGEWDNRRNNVEAVNLRLRDVSDRVLRDFPGVEGGFYLSDGVDRFAGFGFPTNDHESPQPPDKVPTAMGDDPPPREAPFILVQARHSLTLPPDEFQFDIRAVGPSRVAILTQPVGSKRPAYAAAWTMFRVTKPEDLTVQVFRYQVSTGLALGGIVLAAILTLKLLRTQQLQRLDQERLREELRRSEHMAALGKLLAGVAHEVRNPLAGIRSTVQLWDRLPEAMPSQGTREAVIHAVDRLNDIVTRLLYFSRADSSERQPVQINELLTETLELFKAQAVVQQVVIDCEFAGNLPSVSGAANALRQVFLNLMTNALQAMPSGGRIRIITAFDTSGKKVEICLKDSGSGISLPNQQHLFEPFYTTRPEGTGLGLALCREVVQQHGGEIKLAWSSDKGSAFRVVLPAA